MTETIWAVFVDKPPRPEHAARGCPATGWMHEGAEPYRVVVSSDPGMLPALIGDVRPYTGDEDTVTIDELMHGLRR